MSKAIPNEQKVLNILSEEFSDNSEEDEESETEIVIEKSKAKPRKEYVMTEARKEGIKKAQEKRREIGQKSREEKEAKKLLPKPKKPATEYQLANMKKGQEMLQQRREEKRIIREQEQAELKKKQEELIVKKALSIKKKQIKQQAILDQISDDDTPVEKIKEIAKRVPVRKALEQVKPLANGTFGLEPVKPVSFYDQYKFV